MKARPILFSTPMVQALLEGGKTQTRRILKPQILDGAEGFDEQVKWEQDNNFPCGILPKKCPFGTVGDLLYVRETIHHGGYYGAPLTYAADGKHSNYEWPSHWKKPCRPSIHMPRWASRLTLEITDIKVERLQDISEKDAKSEGVSAGLEISHRAFCRGQHGNAVFPTYRIGFQDIWRKINGLDSWDNNPWVWCVEFKVHKVNVDKFSTTPNNG